MKSVLLLPGHIGPILVALTMLPASAGAWVTGNGNSETTRFSMSGDGRYVAFQSDATDLVTGDSNAVPDIFVLDTSNNEVIRASVGYTGAQANGASSAPAISLDGTHVAFTSAATNLIANGSNVGPNVFVRDVIGGTTVLANISTSGTQGAFGADSPSLNADGTKVAFSSGDSDLVADDTNGRPDIFVRDLSAGTIVRASLNSAGEQATHHSFSPAISADGTKVAFYTSAANMVPGGTGGQPNVFVRDLMAGTTLRASVGYSGENPNSGCTNPVISANGMMVAFPSMSSNLTPQATSGEVNIYVRDMAAGSTVRASLSSSGAGANSSSFVAALSADGTKVAFESSASNLVLGDTNGKRDVFVRDLARKTTVRISLTSTGAQSSGNSFLPSINSDGSSVAFKSTATDLEPGDTNGFSDVFVRSTLSASGPDWALYE